METKQVFGTDSPNRWQRIKWATRILGVVVALAIITVFISVFDKDTHALPTVFNKFKDYKTAIQNDTAGVQHASAGCTPKEALAKNPTRPLPGRRPAVGIGDGLSAQSLIPP